MNHKRHVSLSDNRTVFRKFFFTISKLFFKILFYKFYHGQTKRVFLFSWKPSRLEQYNTSTASLQKGKTSLNECPRYDTKQSDSDGPVQ